MKKMLSIVSLCAVLASTQSYAQWSLTGNAGTGTSFLGTTNNFSLRLRTNNVQRMVLDSLGRVGIGTATPINLLTVKGAGSTPASTWANAGAPLFVGFGETTVGNADFILGMGAAAANARPVFIGRKSRGTLAAPAVVATNDYLMSFLASGYDGTGFQNPAAIDFYADGTPTAGNVPARISFVTGSNSSTRAERLKIGSTGDITVNGTQFTIAQATGNVSVGSGNLLLAKKANIKGIVGVNGDTLLGTALMVNANSTNDGIRVANPVDKYVLYAAKSGNNQGIYVTKSSATSTNGCIVGQSTGTSPGLEGYSKNGNGVYAQSDSSVALYAVSNTQNGLYAQTNSALKFAGYFNGDVYSTGTFTSSDARFKSNIVTVDNALQIVNTLQPRSYTFKREGEYAMLQLPQGNHYGLLAQDVEKVLPNLVKDASMNIREWNGDNATAEGAAKMHNISFKAVNYTELIPIMVKAIQELSATNEVLKTKADKVDELQQQIDELKALVKGGNAKVPVANTSVQLTSASLDQNYPNPPVNKATRIRYNIPKAATKAELLITDNDGKSIKQITLTNSGKGQLNIDTAGLAAGTYSYSLLVDGKVIETKKMLIVQ